MIKKDSLLKGTLILALAAFTARFLGVFQRVPLQNLLDDSGMATFSIANNIYLLLLPIATAGIPSTVSKLISEKTALGREAEAAQIFRAAVWFAVVSGLVITAFLYLFAPYYAVNIAHDADAVPAIQMLAPALLLFPVIAIMRGYFQGRQMMMAGGLSQIIEQIARVVTAIVLAYVLLAWGYGRATAVAGASFGGVFGAVGAFVVMMWFWRRLKRTEVSAASANAGHISERAGKETLPRYREIYRTLLSLSIPISLISLAIPFIYFIDTSITILLLKGQAGEAAAKDILGVLSGRAQSISGIPPVLAIALSQSIVPIISAAYARKEIQEAERQASLALRLALLSGLPLIVALIAAARPLNGLLFSDTDGTGMIMLMTASSLFQITMLVSGSILMGMGQVRKQIGYVLAGVILKLALSFLLAPYLGVYGIICATIVCFLLMTQLNLRLIRRTLPVRILGRRWAGMLVTIAVMLAAGLGLDALVSSFVHPFGGGSGAVSRLDFGVQAILVGMVSGALYPLLLAATRVIGKEDIASFPAPLRRLIQRAAKLLGRGGAGSRG
ncbi:putative polysaccharide biosynthesis protein [Paenibacillus sp. y28]|uniref:putative polysaccharide biosynthesis protein n=1 Tax=Paenibacillus sp. y28 TaxID=3129110 RepID=UPI0030164986